MKVTLIPAEYATALPNGLFTIVNGGIESLSIGPSEKAAMLQGYLLVRIQQEAPEGGKHSLRMTLMDADGQAKAPPINFGFESPTSTAAVAMALGVNAQLEPGEYAFHAVLDNQLMASAPVMIIRQKPAKGGRKPKTSEPQ